MTAGAAATRVHRRLIDSLYTEAMLLADEARGYFDEVGREQRDMLGAMDRVVFSCESLKVTTRLMHVIAWLLTQRAVAASSSSTGARSAPMPQTAAGARPSGSALALTVTLVPPSSGPVVGESAAVDGSA